ncbi:hypothetical protein G6F24_017226 [Rhizopus arrhizus]|nr:hypothetical protein G6F24_017226 [Rhizopus arrhizus]
MGVALPAGAPPRQQQQRAFHLRQPRMIGRQRQARPAVGARHARELGDVDAARDHLQRRFGDRRVMPAHVVTYAVGYADHALTAGHHCAVAAG